MLGDEVKKRETEKERKKERKRKVGGEKRRGGNSYICLQISFYAFSQTDQLMA